MRAVVAGEEESALARWKQVARAALTHEDAGRYEEADRGYVESLDVAEKGELPLPYVEASLYGRVHCLQPLHRFAELRDVLRRLLEVRERLGDTKEIVKALLDLGYMETFLGDAVRAQALLLRSVELADRLKDAHARADGLMRLGAAELLLGRYARARLAAEEAAGYFRRVEDPQSLAEALQVLGDVQVETGDYDGGRASFERALELSGGLEPAFRARVLHSLAWATAESRKYERAAALFDAARRAFEAAGVRELALWTLVDHGTFLARRGRAKEALALLEQARAGAEALPRMVSYVRIGRAEAELGLGEEATARALLEGVAAEAAKAKDARIECYAELRLARLDLRAHGGAPRALAHVERALDLTARMTEGLTPIRRQYAWERAGETFELALQTAFAQSDASTTFALLERTRARSLLRSLGAARPLADGTVDPSARDAVAQALARVKECAFRLEVARRGGRLEEVRPAVKALEKAQADYRGRLDRLQQERWVRYPASAGETRTLAQAQADLGEDAVLVEYACPGDEVHALVVGKKIARSVPLGSYTEIAEAVATLRAGLRTPDDHDEEARRAAKRRVRERLLDPLEIPPSTKTLLVSPDAELALVPFALLDRHRRVAFVPSATAYAALGARGSRRGRGTLALGDPRYGSDDHPAGAFRSPIAGYDLRALPKSRLEVEAVTGPEDVRLLDVRATEANLRQEIGKRPWWRSVHFACHGLLDRHVPEQSALALTPTRAPEDDGLLSVLEIVGLRVPAEVAVLSACHTGLGSRMGGEGLLSLSSAFLHAGTPRVIASLWKVDDDATRALMTEFYHVWNGEDAASPAEALRAAQDHVRGQKRWEHPYYWAAWVLWGRPD